MSERTEATFGHRGEGSSARPVQVVTQARTKYYRGKKPTRKELYLVRLASFLHVEPEHQSSALSFSSPFLPLHARHVPSPLRNSLGHGSCTAAVMSHCSACFNPNINPRTHSTCAGKRSTMSTKSKSFPNAQSHHPLPSSSTPLQIPSRLISFPPCHVLVHLSPRPESSQSTIPVHSSNQSYDSRVHLLP